MSDKFDRNEKFVGIKEYNGKHYFVVQGFGFKPKWINPDEARVLLEKRTELEEFVKQYGDERKKEPKSPPKVIATPSELQSELAKTKAALAKLQEELKAK